MVLCPCFAYISSSAIRESFIASSLIGRTIPVVPRTESPSTIPSLGLNVFLASSFPPGILTVTFAFLLPIIFRIAFSAIWRGTGLIAGCPGGIFNPSCVIVPTPSPPKKEMSPSSSNSSTFVTISLPFVTSGSSPASFTTPQTPNSLGIISR